MLYLYTPVPGGTAMNQVATNGDGGVSLQAIEFNILIELRVMNELLYGQQRGVVFDTLESLRSDVVNATPFPPI
jgi:hypothetical protein